MITNIQLPLQISSNRLKRNDNVKKSIDDALTALLNTSIGSVPCDMQYGFTLQGLRFEMVDELQGTIYNGGDSKAVYDKKMSGTSKNVQTFASDFNDAVQHYERRLIHSSVAMTYISQSRTIAIVIKGTIKATQEPYVFSTTFNLWN